MRKTLVSGIAFALTAIGTAACSDADDACGTLTTPTCDSAPSGSCPGTCEPQIWDGDATVSSPADLQALAGYTSVTGNLTVECPDCPSLQGLACLERVEGELVILGCDVLEGLSGLDCLSAVGGDFRIVSNGALQDLGGLESLVSVDGNLVIGGNPSLRRICGVTRLEKAGALTVDGNPLITNLDGFYSLAQVEGGISVSANPSIINLFGLGALHFAGSVRVAGNVMLRYFDGLENLSTVYEDFSISGNFHLKSLEGLAGLEAISTGTISGNRHLPSCAVEGLNEQLQTGMFASQGNDESGACGADWQDDEADCVFDTDVCVDGDDGCDDSSIVVCIDGAWHDVEDCGESGQECIAGDCDWVGDTDK